MSSRRLVVSLVVAALVAGVSAVSCERPPRQRKADTVERKVKRPVRRHASHEHSHGAHPHSRHEHHHHPHPHPHLDGANDHHHPY